MIRNDGEYVIYRIQHKWKNNDNWAFSIENDQFFPASDKCWQETGVHGTYDLKEAKEAFDKTVAQLDPNRQFRLVKVVIKQTTIPLH